MSRGLRIDLAKMSFDVRLQARPNVPGWQIIWQSFGPIENWVRIRLARVGTVEAAESDFIDSVGLTTVKDFVPPVSCGGKE